MIYLKQNTLQQIMIGAFLDQTDGFTPLTALTITPADIRLSKNGGVFVPTSSIANAIHNENGWYSTSLSIVDTSILGALTISIQATGAYPIQVECMVLTESAYDTMFGVRINPTIEEIFGHAYESTETFESYLRLTRAVLAGKSHTNGTAFRSILDDKDRVASIVDVENNRTAVVVDPAMLPTP